MQKQTDENLNNESDEKYRQLFELSPLPKWFYDLETFHFLDVNEAALNLYGYTRDEFLNLTVLDIRPEKDIRKVKDAHNNLGEGKIEFGVFTHLKKDGTPMDMEVSGRRMTYFGRACVMVICNNVTDKYKKEKIESLEHRLLERAIKVDANLENTLSNYLSGLESLFDGMYLTLLQVKSGRVYSLASPSMPREYCKAIEGLKVGPKNGSCGTAAYLKQTVIVENIEESEEWADYKGLITPYGYKASWAQPVFDYEQNVIATFAIYYKKVKGPSEQELELLEKNASLFSVILENHRKTDEIQKSNQRYEYVTRATFDAIWDFDMAQGHVQWGESYEEIFGRIDYPNLNERDKVIARLHPEERKDIIADAAKALDGNSNKWSLEHRYLKADGSYAHVINRGIIIRDEDGKPLRAIGAMQDVTKERAERGRLQLIESVITNTSDAVLITEANPVSKPGPKIIYVNKAFEKYTGYSADEVIGKTPRILQGPKTDRNELDRLREAIEANKSFETTLINYRKDGSEYWNNISINPVKNNEGEVTHFVAIQRDVTKRKNEEIQKLLITEISELFNKDLDLESTVEKVMKHLVNYGDFSLAETWLISEDGSHLSLLTSYSADEQTNTFYQDSSDVRRFDKGIGLPGNVWQELSEIHWSDIDEKKVFLRHEAAKKAGLKEALGMPLISKGQLVGVVVFGSRKLENDLPFFKNIFGEVGRSLAGELERKKIEEELSLLFRNSPDILCIAGPDGYFKRVNPAFSELLGYTEEEIISIPFIEMIHPEDREFSKSEYADTISGKRRAVSFENRYKTSNGEYKWISWNSSDLFKEEGYAFAYGRDITDKKKLESLLENATELSRLGFWEVDLLKDEVYWSPMVRELYEVSRDYRPTLKEAIGFYSEEAQSMVQRYVNEAISVGKGFSFELPLITAKGNEQWVKCIGKTETRNGQVVKITGSFQDVQKRKEADQQLRLSNERFEKVSEATNDAIWDWDIEEGTLYWGIGFEKNFGYEVGEFVPTMENWTQHIHKRDRKRVGTSFNEAVGNPKARNWQEEYRFKRKNGEYAFVQDRGVIIRAENGNATRMVGAITDITERKKYEKSLKDFNASLEKQAHELQISNAELEQFAYVASHDLQEPLRMVTSFLSQLEKRYGDKLDDKAQKYIYFAVDGAKRMREIILDLLDFSRVGHYDSQPTEVDTAELIDEVKALHRKSIEEKNAEVVMTTEMPVVVGQRSPLLQVFQNLISNSLKYSRDDLAPKIEVSATSQNGEWVFSIKDNGIGISQEYFDKIFVIFQRLHGRGEYDGTGMGLAIVKKIVESFNGRIWLESKEGAGTTFYYSIPKQKLK